MDAFFYVSFERWEPFLASNSIRLKLNDGAVVGHFICVGLFRYSVIPLFRLFRYSAIRYFVIPLFRIPCFEDSQLTNNNDHI